MNVRSLVPLAAEPPLESLHDALSEAVAVDRELRRACARVAAGDPGALAALRPLLAERDALVGRIGGLVLEHARAGGRVRLDPAEPEVAEAPEEDEPQGARPQVAADIEPAAPPDARALEALVQGGLGPNWTVEPPAPTVDLRPLLDDLGEPPRIVAPGPAAERELAALSRAVGQRDRWVRLDLASHQALLEHVAWRARALQEVAEVPKSLFQTLTQHTQQHRPGYVVGLSLAHTPPHGTWYDSARHSWGRLREPEPDAPNPEQALTAAAEALARAPSPETVRRAARRVLGAVSADDPRVCSLFAPHAGHLRGAAFKRLRKAIRGRAAEASADPEPLPDSWPGHRWTRGKRAVVVGSEDARLADRVRRAFGLAEVSWESGRHARRVRAVSERVERGSVDLVVALVRFLSHEHSHLLSTACKRAGVPFVPVESGYGVDGIRRRLEAVLDPTAPG